ncbi:hypothetical protein LA345_16105 [Burkholderia vietnamiensis]|nr:hypothetical protein [Burkholderia vietnamiensis]
MNEEMEYLIRALNEINKNLTYHSFNGAFKQEMEFEKERLENIILDLLKDQRRTYEEISR